MDIDQVSSDGLAQMVGVIDNVTVLFQSERFAMLTSKPEFHAPLIVKGCDFGDCIEKWNNIDYLKSAVDKNVAVHVCPEAKMNFLTKNFCYKTLDFPTLVERCQEETHKEYFLSENEVYYLRSLAEDQRKNVADFRRDFPSLSQDVIFPDYIPCDKIFSSVFRMSSSRCQMWTHYDIMDNILMQIVGKKRVTLFSPKDVPFLYLSGDKSRVVDLESEDSKAFPLFIKAVKHVGVLEAGDALFIPALWFHSTTAETFSISVNVFWRGLDVSYYDGKDLYGNKDLLCARMVDKTVEKSVCSLKKLPEPYKTFYGLRLIAHIKEILNIECDLHV